MHKTVKFLYSTRDNHRFVVQERGRSSGTTLNKILQRSAFSSKSIYEERVPFTSSKKKMNKRMINKMMMIEYHPPHL